MAPNIINSKINILFVSGSEFSNNTNKTLFQRINDCEVSTTTNPEHAYRLFNTHIEHNRPFDIVFLEYLLNRTNGITLSKKLIQLAPDIQLEFFSSLFLEDANIKHSLIELFGYDKEPVTDLNQAYSIIQSVRKKRMACVTV